MGLLKKKFLTQKPVDRGAGQFAGTPTSGSEKPYAGEFVDNPLLAKPTENNKKSMKIPSKKGKSGVNIT